MRKFYRRSRSNNETSRNKNGRKEPHPKEDLKSTPLAHKVSILEPYDADEVQQSSAVVKTGILYKWTSGIIRKKWLPRLCEIRNNCFCLNHGDTSKKPIEIPLISCTIKEVDKATKRFTVLSGAYNRKFYFKADREEVIDEWINVISEMRTKLLENELKHSRSASSVVTSITNILVLHLLHLPGNQICCDCGAADPRWIVVNYGILVCITCCGIHREMGVQISKTQSLTIDYIAPPNLLIAKSIGNKTFNAIMERSLKNGKKISSSCTNSDRKSFIENKYINHKYTVRIGIRHSDVAGIIECNDMKLVLQAFVENVNFMAPLPNHPKLWNALMYAISLADESLLPIMEFIIQNRDFKSRDSTYTLDYGDLNGETAVHLAVRLRAEKQLKLLLLGGARPCLLNSKGVSPLDIAKESNAPEIYRILTLAAEGNLNPCCVLESEDDLTSKSSADNLSITEKSYANNENIDNDSLYSISPRSSFHRYQREMNL